MLSRLTAPQLDYLKSLAADASDHHALDIITCAVTPLHMHWISNDREEIAMGTCVDAFNALATRLGMEWVDGDAFPIRYTAPDGACYRRTSQLVWARGQECMVFARGAYVHTESPLCVHIDRLGRVLGTED